MYETYLNHHGIKGMKWGVRRYRNKDGSLTSAGRKHYSKEYKKEAIAASDELRKKYGRMNLEAYNKAADIMNNGGIDKYNKQQEKKYGKDYEKRDGYDEGLSEEFAKHYNKILNKSVHDFYNSNEHAKKAQKLVDKYGMADWDELAKDNTQALAELRKLSGL